MTLPEHVPLAEVKNRLSEVVGEIERKHGRVVITKHGRPAAVLMSIEDLSSLEETLEIMSNPRLMAEIREGLAGVERGEGVILTKEEALRLIKKRR